MADGTRTETMIDEKVTAIRVDYGNVDGYHVFTSEAVRGLYVSSRNAHKVYEALPEVVREILEIKHGQKFTVQIAASLEEF